MGFEDMPIAPQTDQDKLDCETPDGIRRRLRQVYYRHGNPIVHACFRMSEARGMRGEDMYTVLAFEALKALEELTRRHTYVLERTPFPAFPLNTGEKP